LKRKLYQSAVLLILGLCAPLSACMFSWMPLGETLPIWFQRSGSILVLFSVITEFILLSMHTTFYPGENTVTDTVDDNIQNYKLPYDILSVLTASFSIIGTIIWGYGDIIVKSL